MIHAIRISPGEKVDRSIHEVFFVLVPRRLHHPVPESPFGHREGEQEDVQGKGRAHPVVQLEEEAGRREGVGGVLGDDLVVLARQQQRADVDVPVLQGGQAVLGQHQSPLHGTREGDLDRGERPGEGDPDRLAGPVMERNAAQKNGMR